MTMRTYTTIGIILFCDASCIRIGRQWSDIELYSFITELTNEK